MVPTAEARKAAAPMKRRKVTQERSPATSASAVAAAKAKAILSAKLRVAMQARQRVEPRERLAPVVAPGAQPVLVARRVLVALLALGEPLLVHWALSC